MALFPALDLFLFADLNISFMHHELIALGVQIKVCGEILI